MMDPLCLTSDLNPFLPIRTPSCIPPALVIPPAARLLSAPIHSKYVLLLSPFPTLHNP